MEINFSEWLQEECRTRNWTQAELARRTGLSTAYISHLFAGTRKPGTEACQMIAVAFHLPPEIVFRTAGLLPYASEQAVNSVLMEFKLNELTQAQINEVLQYIEFIQQRDKRK